MNDKDVRGGGNHATLLEIDLSVAAITLIVIDDLALNDVTERNCAHGDMRVTNVLFVSDMNLKVRGPMTHIEVKFLIPLWVQVILYVFCLENSCSSQVTNDIRISVIISINVEENSVSVWEIFGGNYFHLKFPMK